MKNYSSERKWKILLKQASPEPIEIDEATGKYTLQSKHIDLLIDHLNQYIELNKQELNTLNQLGIKTVNSNGTIGSCWCMSKPLL
jgi:hypothetical protein